MGNIIFSKLLLFPVIVLFYFVFVKSLIYLLPFIFGYIIASIIEPLVDLLNKRLRLHRGVSSFISIIIFISLSGLIIFYIGGLLSSEITKLYNRFPDQSSQIYSYVSDLVNRFHPIYISIPESVTNSITNALYALFNNLISSLGTLASSTLGFIGRIPSLLLLFFFSLISAFFISKDKDKIYSFIRAQMPPNSLNSSMIKSVKEDLGFALLGYIKAQFILMSITFTESAIGLSLIGVNFAIIIALVISIVDALPVLGSGSIYIPWIIAKLLMKDFDTALFLTILYLTVTVVRQTLEPKVISTQIGLYPLVTLMAIYIGLKLFGFIGIILGPIIVITFLALQKMDIIPKFKNTNP